MKYPLALREALHYIPLFRDKIFVIKMSGELIKSDEFGKIIMDIALLQTLGIHPVIIHGIDAAAKDLLPNVDGIGHEKSDVINDDRLNKLKPVCTMITIDILSRLSEVSQTIVPIRACTGTFIRAKRKGVINGINQQLLGEVDTIDVEIIGKLLKEGAIPVISPLATTAQGELLYLPADELAAEVAIWISAAKLLFMTGIDGIFIEKEMLSQLPLEQAIKLAAEEKFVSGEVLFKLKQAIKACQRGIPRVHFLNGWRDGSLLQEIFSRDGNGTMLYNDIYLNIRPAELDDVARIIEMAEVPIQEEKIIHRTADEIRGQINEYLVYEKDGQAIGCCRLHYWQTEKALEFSHLVIDQEYRHRGIAAQLLEYCEKEGRKKGMERIFALTTRAESWFVNRGFQLQAISTLPDAKRKTYDRSRHSKIMGKSLL